MQWRAVDEQAGLWSAEYRIPGFLCRSVAVKLPSGGYLVFSPGAELAEGFADEMGPAEILLAPNSFHHIGLPAWQEVFPSAVVAAHPSAHGRLRKKGRSGLTDLGPARSALPERASILEVPATRIGEVWLRVVCEGGITWCVGDSFFNMPKLARRLRPRLVQRMLKAAPGLQMSNLMKWGGLTSRRRFKEWVMQQLDADQPETLVVLHGDVLEEDVTAALRALIDRRL